RSNKRGKGPIGYGNKQPQERENKMVPDPLAINVDVVEETNVIYWCDRCFIPNAPCEVDQQVEEEADDDNTDDDACMMECSTNSQQGTISTKVISARTAT
ncbi:hypothetical protein KI387_019428, partial [Taxus chinensis]